MILPLSSSGPRALRPHRDFSNSLSLNFPRQKLSFMDLPSSRPATTIRLPVPPSVSAILRANSHKDRASANQAPSGFNSTSTIAEDDHLSEADSSAPPHSGLSASTSTLGTAETAETELTPPSSALENNVSAAQSQEKASKRKTKQQAAEKRKRRREKERLAKQAIVAAAATTLEPSHDKEGQEEEVDGRAAALAKFRGRSDSTSSLASSAVSKPEEPAPIPQSSTSQLLTAKPVPVWADDLPESTPIESHDFATLEEDDSNGKADAEAAVPPRQGPKFWGHDERNGSFQRSRRGSRSSLHSTNLSRRSSAQDDRLNRPYSPASSQGGWQEVQSRFTKRPAQLPTLRPNSAFIKRPVTKEPLWTHDKYEEQKAWDDRFKTRIPVTDLVARPPEPPWTARSFFPFLFNEPGSRSFVDDKGFRKMTLRISLRPIPDLLSAPSKRVARQRAGVIEVDCLLRVEPPTSSSVPPPLGDDISIIIKLDFQTVPSRVLSLAAQAKLQRQLTEAEELSSSIEAEQATVIAPQDAQENALPEQEDTTPTQAEPLPAVPVEAVPLEQPSANLLYTSDAAPAQDPLAEASAQLRSVVMSPTEEQPSSAHIPSVEQQMAAQDQQYAQHHHQQQALPSDGFFPPEGFPPFPLYHEPFIGMDGFTYYFDPATGQSVPGPPLPFAPGFPPVDVQPSASPVPFFAPRRSHKIEIKAPTPESLAEMRSRPKSVKHRQTPSFPNRPQMLQSGSALPMDPPPPPPHEMFIPGSFEVGGSVFFAPPAPFAPAFSAPPPFYVSNGMPTDPAILAMGVASSEPHPPQTLSAPQEGPES